MSVGVVVPTPYSLGEKQTCDLTRFFSGNLGQVQIWGFDCILNEKYGNVISDQGPNFLLSCITSPSNRLWVLQEFRRM
jgi:hypothetical protein